MSRFVKNTNHKENTYVEFRFESSLRKYEKKPSKKLKCDPAYQQCISHHQNCHSSIKCTHKQSHLQLNSSHYSARSNLSSRPRVPLLQKKIYSSLAKQPKVSNYSQDMEYDVYLHDFEPSELVYSKDLEEDQQFDNIELNADRNWEQVGTTGQLPKHFQSMKAIGPIPEMQEMSSIEKHQIQPDKEQVSGFIIKSKQKRMRQELSSFVEQEPYPSQKIEELSKNVGKQEEIKSEQQDENIFLQEQELDEKQAEIKHMVEQELYQEQAEIKDIVEQEMDQEKAEMKDMFEQEQVCFAEMESQSNNEGSYQVNKLKAEFEQIDKVVRAQNMMNFEESKITINSPFKTFLLSARVFQRARRNTNTIEKLVDWILKSRPYLLLHRNQLLQELSDRYSQEQ